MALYLSFSSHVVVQFAQPYSKLEARADTLGLSRTLLTNKNQENMEKHTLLTLLSQRILALTARIAQLLRYTIIGATKKNVKRPRPLFRQ